MIRMKPTPAQQAALKKEQLDILVNIIAICKQLNLRYYLLGGTLIGAIRHKGFIPWDDDIDIGMMREDYEIFLEKAPAFFPAHYFLQTVWTDPGYLNCFAKVRNSNTTFIETPVVKRKMNHGVFVDIFPLDYYPEDPAEQRKLDRKKLSYDCRIAAELHLPDAPLKNKLKYFLLKLKYPSCRSIIAKREALFQSVPKSNLIADYGGFREETCPMEWYGEGVPVSFEGIQVIAPTEYDKLLTQIYGDYMTPPPIEKQEGHHYTTALDLEKPYTEYVK